LDLTVDNEITPTFNALSAVCLNAPAPVLPTTSNNGITGAWSPAVSTATVGTTTYTFTSDAGQCGGTATLDLTVDNEITPTFNVLSAVCLNAPAPVFPSTSNNGITGTWSPAVSTATVGTTTYTFTSDAGQCGGTATLDLTVDNEITPTFNALSAVCLNAPAPVLPTSSTNGITGTWSPAVNTATVGTTTYTFSSDAGQCGGTATLDLTVDNEITPTFTALSAVCLNAPAPVLQTTSTNGITGTWSPAVSTATVGTTTYTFTSDAGQCGGTANLDLTVDNEITPTFNALSAVCLNAPAPVLPTTSTNGITGTWSPAVSTATVGTSTYTFTSDAGQCGGTATLDLTVDNEITPTFNALSAVCLNAPAPVLPTTSTNGITGTWSPAVSTATVGTTTYTFASDAGQCGGTATLDLTVVPSPVADFAINTNPVDVLNPVVEITNTSTGATAYTWNFGDGSENSYTTNPIHTIETAEAGVYLITLIAENLSGCLDTTYQYVSIEESLIYFVPNTFTPDGDQFNQTFKPIFSSGFDPYNFTFLVYDRWGELIFESHDVEIGWNGTYGNQIDKVQDGVYVWKIAFKLKQNDGIQELKGHVNLVR
jgi:gliding motility-associated-like protein